VVEAVPLAVMVPVGPRRRRQRCRSRDHGTEADRGVSDSEDEIRRPPQSMAGGRLEVAAELLKQVRQFIQLNHDVLLDYWNYRVDTEELRERLKPIR